MGISLGLGNVSVGRFCLAKDVARSDWLSSSWRRLRRPACQSDGANALPAKEGIVRAIACRPNRQQQLQSANTHFRAHTHTFKLAHSQQYTIPTHTHTMCNEIVSFAVPTGVCVIYSFHARVSATMKLVRCAWVCVCVQECTRMCVCVCVNVCQVHCAALSPVGDLQPLRCHWLVRSKTGCSGRGLQLANEAPLTQSLQRQREREKTCENEREGGSEKESEKRGIVRNRVHTIV